MTVETGWLIERLRNDRAEWWTGDGWTTESLDAVRFAREEDAQKMIWINAYTVFDDAFATEHSWSDL